MKLFNPNKIFPILAILSIVYVANEGLLSKNGYKLIAIFCSLLTSIIYYALHKKKLNGSSILKKRRRPITTYEIFYIVGLGFLLSRGELSHPVITVSICYFIALLLIGFITRYTCPDTISFTNKTIYLNNYGVEELYKHDITGIKYSEEEQKITIKFKEGTDNFDLLRSEFDLTELIGFLKSLSASCEQEIEISDILTNYYFLKVQ